MDKGDFEQLRQYLKENLKVKVDAGRDCNGHNKVAVSLELQGEEISSSYSYIDD